MTNKGLLQRLRWPRVQLPPSWGIEPVPESDRRLRLLDHFVLWSSLGVGLLVLEAGALLVPALNLGAALVAILVGTVVGVLLLALAGLIGAGTGVPTMVLLRPTLGLRGSFLPTVLNLAQLIGWTAFEFWVMALAADRIGQALFGFSSYHLWLIVFALWCILLALGGPLVVVRQWLEKFGVWLVYGATIWLTAVLLTRYDVGALLRQPGGGGLPFLLAVDLVVAMPISWMPLVADYNRFARNGRAAFWGTYLGYFLTNVWFYGLGALFLLTLNLPDTGPEQLATAILALAGGVVALVVILVDETDNAFADIYSAAVSLQNLWPRLSQRLLVALIGLVSLLLAAFLTMTEYFNFLLLIGSFFVPLFGLLAADYFVVRKRHYQVEALYRSEGPYWYSGGINWVAVVVWLLGAGVYHLITRSLPWLGASLPAFVVTFLGYLLAARLFRGRQLWPSQESQESEEATP
jgi:NCS1 family nucleobase:cation symporter-1